MLFNCSGMCCGVFKEGRRKGQIDEIAAAAEKEEEEEEELHGWWRLWAWPKEEGFKNCKFNTKNSTKNIFAPTADPLESFGVSV